MFSIIKHQSCSKSNLFLQECIENLQTLPRAGFQDLFQSRYIQSVIVSKFLNFINRMNLGKRHNFISMYWWITLKFTGECWSNGVSTNWRHQWSWILRKPNLCICRWTTTSRNIRFHASCQLQVRSFMPIIHVVTAGFSSGNLGTILMGCIQVSILWSVLDHPHILLNLLLITRFLCAGAHHNGGCYFDGQEWENTSAHGRHNEIENYLLF